MGAICYFTEALKYNKHDKIVWHKLGLSYNDIKEYQKAIECHKNEIKYSQDGTETSPLKNIAVNLISLGKYDEAKTYYFSAMELDSLDHEIYSGIGNAYVFQDTPESYKTALGYYEKALELNENLHVVWCNMGTIVFNQENPDIELALKYYNKSLGIEPFFPEALLNRANYYLKKEQYDLALEDINKSLSLNPRVEAWSIKIQICEATGNHQEAINAYKKTIAYYPESATIRSLIAYNYIDLGNFDKAEDYIYQAKELDPENASTRLELVEVLLISNKFDKAKNELEQIDTITLTKAEEILKLFSKYLLNIIEKQDNNDIRPSIETLLNEEHIDLNWSFKLIKNWIENYNSFSELEKENTLNLIDKLD